MDKLIISTPSELSIIIEETFKKVLLQSNLTTVKSNELPEHLSISQAAEYLNLAKPTLYGFTSNRSIPFIKKGKKLYFKKSDLNKWLSEGRKITKDEIGSVLSKSMVNTGNSVIKIVK